MGTLERSLDSERLPYTLNGMLHRFEKDSLWFQLQRPRSRTSSLRYMGILGYRVIGLGYRVEGLRVIGFIGSSSLLLRFNACRFLFTLLVLGREKSKRILIQLLYNILSCEADNLASEKGIH